MGAAVTNGGSGGGEGSDHDSHSSSSTAYEGAGHGGQKSPLKARDDNLAMRARSATDLGRMRLRGDKEGEESDKGIQNMKRRPKPLLTRAKSDYGPRVEPEEVVEQDDEALDWGARHGFEDHYTSQEYVSQLANVSCSFLSSFVWFVGQSSRGPLLEGVKPARLSLSA